MDKVNSLAMTAMPFIEKMALTLPEYGREDATQAGFLTAIELASRWSEAAGYPFLSMGNKKSIYRDMLRESAKIAPENHKLFRVGLDPVTLDNDHPKESGDDDTEREASLQDHNTDLERDALTEQMIDAIRDLPEDGRSIMSHFLAGYTVSEYAREFDLSQSAADRLYQRSLEALKAALRG